MRNLLAVALVTLLTAGYSNAQTANIEVDPFALLLGGIYGQVMFPVTDSIAIGPRFGYLNFTLNDVSIKTSNFGARADFAFQGPIFVDGFYGSVFANTGSFEVEGDAGNGIEGTAKESGILSFGAGAGYHWFWDTFNLRLGASVASSNIDEITIEYSNGDSEVVRNPGLGVGLEFLMGLKF